jgi:hypothetical protein
MRQAFENGGEGGIRTLDTSETYTGFRVRPGNAAPGRVAGRSAFRKTAGSDPLRAKRGAGGGRIAERILAAVLGVAVAGGVVAEPLPAWVRVVDWDGQVQDYVGPFLASVRDCGDPDLSAYDAGAGVVVIDTGLEVRVVRYEQRFRNEGAVTGNPNSTGGQLVYIEQPGALFADGAEGCVLMR